LLIGASKALFVASIVAIFFPHAGQERPVLYGLLGAALTGVLAMIGLMVMKKETEKDTSENKKRRRR